MRGFKSVKDCNAGDEVKKQINYDYIVKHPDATQKNQKARARFNEPPYFLRKPE